MADSGRKSSSFLPEVILQVRETIEPTAGEREGVGAEGGGGAGAGVGIGDRGLGAIKKLFSKKPKFLRELLLLLRRETSVVGLVAENPDPRLKDTILRMISILNLH